MKITRAILSGVLGAVIVYLIVFIAGRASNTPADLCLLLGGAITGDAGAWTWILGVVMQLVIAIIAAMVYGAIFEWVTLRAGPVIGCVVGIAHLVVAGIAIGFLPVAGLVGAGLQPPGGFMEYLGVVVLVAFCVAHLAFGTLVGALYGVPRHRIAPAAAWRDMSA